MGSGSPGSGAQPFGASVSIQGSVGWACAPAPGKSQAARSIQRIPKRMKAAVEEVTGPIESGQGPSATPQSAFPSRIGHPLAWIDPVGPGQPETAQNDPKRCRTLLGPTVPRVLGVIPKGLGVVPRGLGVLGAIPTRVEGTLGGHPYGHALPAD